MKKKFLALVMTLSMVLSLVPMTALAAGDGQEGQTLMAAEGATGGETGGTTGGTTGGETGGTTGGETGGETGGTTGGTTGGETGGTNNSTEEKDPPAKPEGVAKIGETYYQSMKDAFKAAKPGDTIELQEDITFWDKKDSLEVKVSKNFDGELTIDLNDHYIDGNNVDKCIWRTGTTDCWPSKLTVKNGTLKNGDAESSSGGAIQWQGDLAIENCKFENNDNCAIVVLKGKVDILKSSFTGNETRKTRRLSGAAIQITENQGTTIRDSVFSDNTVNEGYSMGGAVYVDHNSVDITDCTFEGNSAPYGGAIAAAEANVTIGEDTKFLNNTATTWGGAIYVQNVANPSTLKLNGPITMTGNHASYGGAISAMGSTITLENVTAKENTATRGGFLCNYRSGASISSCTIEKNSADIGGGLYLWSQTDPTTTSVDGSVVNNEATVCAADIYSDQGNTLLVPATVSGTLTDCNHPIDGWYYDKDGSRWNAHDKDKRYVEQYIPSATEKQEEVAVTQALSEETSEEPVVQPAPLALKAAHGLMYDVVYKVSGDAPEGYTAPAKQTLKANEKYTVAAVPESVTGTKDGVNGTYSFSGWKTADGTTLTGEQELTGDVTLSGVWTFTKKSSSGGHRPSNPPVTIPDDVPTGLNGKDHYAYVVGYPDGMVYPQKNITRAEVATIFFRLLEDETREANMTKSNGYNDMKEGAWYTCAVSTLSKMGIIKGYEDGSFKPDASISRAEFAAIAARFDPDGDTTPATFSDVSSHWAKDEISIAANHGWIKGYEDGSFKPDQKITRAETMTLVNRVLKRLPETKDDLHKDMKTWPDNQNESAWFYLAVQEATNSHYQKLKKDGTHEKWESMRETRDWAALEK